MKKTLLFLIVLIAFSTIHAQSISENDSILIVNKIDDWNRAWKTKDAVLAAKWYSDDADFTNAFGFSMIGKDSIESFLTRVFKMNFVMAGDSEQTSLKLRPMSENVVLVVSTISRKGQKMSDNSELGDRRTTHHRLFKKQNSWKIVAHLISDARKIGTSKH
ncbi:YybH family protein [Flagellimonas algicola]|uniref:DUF4440 domain-containing protein n=1 Tax=Flagellimonas algicola TaxID=2583815 RepID=A0ABY2WMU3_9FLAO|nr:DUF4440 domain-containing protein [Allomuricauda algicola]TMU56065.1 DUF4440 domain-containing protein [Allomuricauda algicola]